MNQWNKDTLGTTIPRTKDTIFSHNRNTQVKYMYL